MADHDQEQKTEQATEKRLSEAFERGQFAKSHELTVLFPIAAVLGVLALTTQSASHNVAEYSVGMFTRFATTEVGYNTVMGQIGEAMLSSGASSRHCSSELSWRFSSRAACRADSGSRRRQSR